MNKHQQARIDRAKERYADCMDAMRAQHERMREDLRFSNPGSEQQWTAEAIALRGSRPTMTFDNTNKFIFQVVNDGRASVPSIQTVPADGFAHVKAAEAMNGRIRHIEYASRAKLAYDTSLELSARCGLGWILLRPHVVDADTGQQEPRIIRVHDPFACLLDASWTEPDGSDAEYGFVLSPMHKKKFAKAYPKFTDSQGWADDQSRWTTQDQILVAEYFEFEVKKTHKIIIRTPDGEEIALTEKEFWDVADAIGAMPEVVREMKVEVRSVTWTKMTGCEELESIPFPSKHIPIVPVIGSELWVDGERYLCGLTRRLMDGQRMHNAEMSAYTEAVISQPKAPFLVSDRAIEGREKEWRGLNSGNPAFLVFNDVDNDGQRASPPVRLQPPQMPAAFANGAMMAASEMEASVGMYKSSFGQQSNAVSGRAKQADRRESDTATFHFTDNRAISIQQVGRIIFDMERRLSEQVEGDGARSVRTMSEDNTPGMIRYEPQMKSAVRMKGGEVAAINPLIGEYDLRVTVGPSFLTQNQETAAELGEMFQGAPQLLPILGPTWVRMKGIPGAEKIAKLLLSMAPKEVQQIEAEDGKEAMPPAAQMALRQKDQQIQELSQALEAAAAEADKTGIEKARAKTEREKAWADAMVRGYEAVTDRLKIAPPMTAEGMALLIQQTMRDALTIPPVEPEEAPDDQMQPPMQPQAQMQPPAMEDGGMMQPQENATDAGMNAPLQPATEGIES